MFEIEDSVKLHASHIAPLKKFENYPFKLMVVGQSFFIPVDFPDNGEVIRHQKRLDRCAEILRSAVRRYQRNVDPSFYISIRTYNHHRAKELNDGKTGIRVWRIEDPSIARLKQKVREKELHDKQQDILASYRKRLGTST